MADTIADVLRGYTQQHLPSLALRARIASTRVAASVACDASTHDDHTWIAAVIRLVCAYADATDVLLAELREGVNGGTDRLSIARIQVDLDVPTTQAVQTVRRAIEQHARCCPFDKLVQAAREEGMGLLQGESPALITIGVEACVSPEWYPINGVAVLRNSETGRVHVIGDGAILSTDMADVFARQVVGLLGQWKERGEGASFASLTLNDDQLMSQCEPMYDPKEAHMPIDWLVSNAHKRPNAIAHELCDEPDDDDASIRFLTYKQLDELSSRMANWLCSVHGVQPGTPVGVCRRRDEHFYVAMAAIFKAGGCYLPIDRDLPIERKTYIITDSHAGIVLTDSDNVDVMRDEDGDKDDNDNDNDDNNGQCRPYVSLDSVEVQQAISRHSKVAPKVNVGLDDLAYILYTSGTSGKPKGCLLMHRGLYWAVRAFVEIPRAITDPNKDKRLAMAAVAFDVHVSEMVQCWAIGVRLVSVASRMSLLAELQETIERFGITHVGMVPSMIEATLTKGPGQLPIKYITSGGEKVSDAVLTRWASHPDVLFANMYGPTEATIGCAARVVRGTNEPKENIGFPFVGCSAYIVDANLNIVPKGVAGELVVEGPLVARGYLNLPDATARSFMAWPRPDARAYRTGDLVRMNFDGSLSIHGRIDSQIKLRGVRIESEGVSAVVKEAAAAATANGGPTLDAVSVICTHGAVRNAEVLVTFVTLQQQSAALRSDGEEGRAATVNERRGAPGLLGLPSNSTLLQRLRQAVTEKLASYMRPSHIIPLTFFPLSHNGKIDTKPLVALFSSTPIGQLMSIQGLGGEEKGRGNESTDEGPLSATEQTVAELVARLTGTDVPSSAQQRLMESGLTSLNCARLTALIRRQTGAHLSVAQVLACDTIGECAAMTIAAIASPAQSEQGLDWHAKIFEEAHRSCVLAILPPDSIEALLPPLPVQSGVLFHAMHNSTGYVQHFAYQLKDGVTVSALRKAWASVQSRMDILRVAFVLDDGQLVQVLLRPEHCFLPFNCHATRLQSDKTESILQGKLFTDTVSASINDDLTTPMFAVTAFVDDALDHNGYKGTSDDELLPTAIVVSFSHAIYDAYAVRSIISALDAALRGAAGQDSTDQLRLETVVRHIHASAEETHKQYWQHALRGALQERAKLQYVPVRRPHRGEEARRRSAMLDDIAFDDVQSACSSIGVTLQTFFNVAFAFSARALLVDWHEHALFGNVRSGRNIPLDGIASAAYPLVTTVPCVVNIGRDRSAREVMRSAHQAWASSTAHENVSLGQVQTWVQQRDLIDVLFSCRVEDSADRGTAYEIISHVDTSKMDPEYALAVEVLLDQTADSVDVRVAHSPSVFSSDKIDLFLARMLDNIRALAHDEHPISDEAIARKGIGQPPTTFDASLSLLNADAVQEMRRSVATFLRLDLDIVQPATSLVSLGLTSLRAVSLCHTLHKLLGVEMDPVEVVQGDTILAMAASARKQSLVPTGATKSSASTWSISEEERIELGDVRITPEDEVEFAPCTPLQAGMLSQTIATEGKLYTHAFAFALHDPIRAGKEAERLQHAWTAVHEKFGILRSSFHFVAKTGAWMQVQHNAAACPLRIVRMTDAQQDSASSLRRSAIETLDLTSDQSFAHPPICLLLSNDGSLMVLALHHAMYDGVSLANLLSFLAKAFYGQALPETPSFLTLARDLVTSEEQATSYWVDRLHDVRSNNFVTQDSTITANGADANQAWRDGVHFTSDESHAITRFCRRYRCSVQSVGQVALAAMLHRRSHESDVVFCQVVSGRTHKMAGEVMGPVFNTVAVRVSLSVGTTGKQAVRRAQQDNAQSLSWQHAPLRLVQRRLQRTTLSDVLFLFQPSVTEEVERSPPWTLLTSTSEQGTTQYALNVELHEAMADSKGLTMVVRASAAASAIGQAELNDIVLSYKAELLGIVNAPNKPLASNGTQKGALGSQRNDVDGHREGQAIGKLLEGPLIDVLREVVRIDPALLVSDQRLSSIGVDSIAAMQIASRARKLGYSLTPMLILRCTTIAELMHAVVTGSKQNKERTLDQPLPIVVMTLDSGVVGRARIEIDRSLQEHARPFMPTAGMRYLFAGWQRSGGRQFQICIARKMRKRIDRQAIQRSWSAVVARRAILRSIIVPSHPGKGGQVPLVLFLLDKDRWSGTFDFVDQSCDRSDGDVHDDERARTFGRHLLLRPASMRKPSSRLTVLQLPSADYVFVQMPHTHYDAFTVPRVLHELWKSYVDPAKSEGEAVVGDDAELEAYLTEANKAGVVEDAHEQERKTYWRSVMGPAAKPHVWVACGDEDAKRTVSGTVTYYVREKRRGTPTVQALQHAALRLNLSPAALLTSTWAHVHAQTQQSRHGHEQSLTSTFAFVNSGRALGEGMEDVFAPTINLVPTCVTLLHAASTAQHDLLRHSMLVAARTVQQRWRDQPSWAVQSAMSDVCRWVHGDPAVALCNTTLNVHIRPSNGASLRDTASANASRSPTSHAKAMHNTWSPLALNSASRGPEGDRGWSLEELDSFSIPTLFRADSEHAVCDPSVRIDARLVVAASRDAEPVVILEAEVAREFFRREAVDEALVEWARLLNVAIS